MTYNLEYLNENEFKKLERSLKKYNMLAYKKLMFDYYPSMREGKFSGIVVKTSSKDNTEAYELVLPTDSTFKKLHGDIKLHYTVYKNENLIMLEKITPEDVLANGHNAELTQYKGVMISKNHSKTDMFKINLLDMLNK